MNRPAPLYRLQLSCRIVTYAVTPEVRHFTNTELQLVHICILRSDQVRIVNELEIKLVKIGANVHTLPLRIEVLVDEDKVWVYFDPTIFSQDKTNLIPFARLVFYLAYWAILKKWRDGHAWVIHEDTKLDKFQSIIYMVVVDSKEADLSREFILEYNRANRAVGTEWWYANNLVCGAQVESFNVRIFDAKFYYFITFFCSFYVSLSDI